MIQKDFQDVRKIEQIVSSEISPREKKQVSAPPNHENAQDVFPIYPGNVVFAPGTPSHADM
jgi:hypothetical protein